MKTKFQFHYGTIKRLENRLGELCTDLFQFHYGTIKSNPDFPQIGIFLISIPLWYD